MAAHATIDLANLLPATFTSPELTDEEFLALCEQFPDATLEHTEEGEIIVMPPTDPMSSARVARVTQRLANWADSTKRGVVCGPDGGFKLPTRSRRSPDAAWFENFPEGEGTFPVFAPQFVIEVRSRYDRLPVLQEKMRRYLVAGVKLGWLIDPFDKTVTIYRPIAEPQTLLNPKTVSGEGPVAGFVLDLDGIL